VRLAVGEAVRQIIFKLEMRLCDGTKVLTHDALLVAAISFFLFSAGGSEVESDHTLCTHGI
jgi:hypothetical protein